MQPQLNAAQPSKQLLRRSIAVALAVPGIGVGVAFYRMAVLGMDTFQVLLGGIDAIFPGVPFGLLWLLTTLVMLLVPVFMKRKLIGLGTLFNMVVVGYATEFSHLFLVQTFPDSSIFLRALWLVIGVLVIAISIAFFIAADLGVSAYDAITLIISERNPRLKFKVWRIICDCTCLVVGIALFLLSGRSRAELFTLAGIGTLVAAVGMGPLIAFFREKLARPAIYGQAKS